MGATKESPATQILEWAVGKLDEASKTDWVEKFSTMTAARPAYLRSGFTSSPSLPAPASAGGGAGQGELDAALARAAQAEARAEGLARRVQELEEQLAVGDEDHKHWWSRKH